MGNPLREDLKSIKNENRENKHRGSGPLRSDRGESGAPFGEA
jgi:hypothetical protein